MTRKLRIVMMQIMHSILFATLVLLGGLERATAEGKPVCCEGRRTVGLKFVATNWSSVIIKDSGHWIMEEQPRLTMDALVKFW